MWEAIQSNKRKSMALIFVMGAVLIILGYALGSVIDPGLGVFGMIVATVVWIILLAISFSAGESILLSCAGAREVTHDTAPQLFNIVEEMKIASGLPALPKVYIIDTDVPNAFAVGLKPERASVAVTTGLLSRLNRDELQGVIAHEIGHIVNRDTLFMTMAGVTMGAIILLAEIFLRSLWYGGGRRGGRRSSGKGGGQGAAIVFVVAIVLAIVAPILARILYFACSRRREYLADASASQFTRFPEGLASALEKISGYRGERPRISRALAPMFIVNPLAARGSSAGLFSTHPSTADRIKVLRSMGANSSLAAYEDAYRQIHKGSGSVVGARNLSASVENGVREASAAVPADQRAQRRSAQDIVHRIGNFGRIACSCGMIIKLPPGFDMGSIVCPRCKTRHETFNKKAGAVPI